MNKTTDDIANRVAEFLAVHEYRALSVAMEGVAVILGPFRLLHWRPKPGLGIEAERLCIERFLPDQDIERRLLELRRRQGDRHWQVLKYENIGYWNWWSPLLDEIEGDEEAQTSRKAAC